MLRKRNAMLAAALLPLVGAMFLNPDGDTVAGGGGAGGGSPGAAPDSIPASNTIDGLLGGGGEDDLEMGGGGEGETVPAGEGADTVAGAGSADTVAAGAGAGDDTTSGGAAGDTVAGTAKEDTVAGGTSVDRPTEEQQRSAQQQRQYMDQLGRRYEQAVTKLTAKGADGQPTFDVMDDGLETFNTLREVIEVQGQAIAQLRQETAGVKQERAAEQFWGEPYARAYPKIPVADGKALWNQCQQWATKNGRSHEAAAARWETMMESKVATAKPPTPASKAPVAPPPNKAPVQTRTVGKPTPQPEAPKSSPTDPPQPSVTRKVLQKLGW